MAWFFHLLLFGFVTRWKPSLSDRERDLLLELIALRHQLSVLQRKVPKARFFAGDRWLWAWISRRWSRWKEACVLVKPQTVIRWHRAGFKLFWRWKSRRRGGRRDRTQLIAVIRRMVAENPTWGAPKVHGELLKLGLRVSERTVSRFMPKRSRKGDDLVKHRQNWKTFLENHKEVITAMDFLVVPAWNFRPLYILVILDHGRRVVRHFNVTANPSAEWVKQQLREAFPFDEIPRYLIYDRDQTFRPMKAFLETFGIKPKITAYHCTWQNGFVERMHGSIRRDLLDHVIPLHENHLRRLLKEYLRYYNEDRTHLGLNKDSPRGRPMEAKPSENAALKALPRCGGLHHRYIWEQAA